MCITQWQNDVKQIQLKIIWNFDFKLESNIIIYKYYKNKLYGENTYMYFESIFNSNITI